MTAKTTVTIAATDSQGNPCSNRKVWVTLQHGGSGGSVDGSVIVDRTSVDLDADGEGSVALYPNSAITSANSYYAFVVEGTTPTTVRTIRVPASPSTISWSNDTYKVTDPNPPVVVPDPSTGTDGQVLTTNGSTADWEDVSAGSVPTGTMPNLEGSAYAPAGNTVPDYLTAIDDGLTSTAVAALSAAGDAQSAADAAQADADTAQSTATAASTAAGAAGDNAIEALDHLRSEALERLSTSPRFQVCTPWGGDHDTGAYTTDPPASFSGGFYWRGTVNAIGITDPPASPSDGDVIHSELFTQTAEGIGLWNVFEVAVQWVYDTAAGAWLPTLFFEWTEVGGASEAHSLGTEGPSSAGGVTYPAWYFPQGTPTEIAVDLDFSNAQSKWDLSFWRRTYQGDPDSAFDGAEWVRVSRAIGSTTTSIKTNSAYPWAFGMGSGDIELFDQSVRNGSASGAILASPKAADAYTAGDGQPFDDDQNNTWTPGADAHVSVPSSGGLADGSVTTAKLAAGAVTTAKVTDKAVTLAKMADVATATILGRTSSGTGVPEALTATQARSVIGVPFLYAVCIEPATQKPNTFTTWTPTVSAMLGSGFAAGATTQSGETWTYAGLPLKAGTWACDVVIRKTAASGIITMAIGGSSVGTADGYNASNAGDHRIVVNASFTVAADGQYDLVLTNPTKNASSSAYGWTIQAIDLRRTGA